MIRRALLGLALALVAPPAWAPPALAQQDPTRERDQGVRDRDRALDRRRARDAEDAAERDRVQRQRLDAARPREVDRPLAEPRAGEAAERLRRDDALRRERNAADRTRAERERLERR